jgi:uncharacterized protein YsxB (DUF464 family)
VTKVYYREYYDNVLITIEGHSGFSYYGTDVVCAGISTLAFTLVNTILDEEAHGNLKLIRNFVADGIVCLEIQRFKFSKERIDGIIGTIMTGFYILEDNYPDCIKIE